MKVKKNISKLLVAGFVMINFFSLQSAKSSTVSVANVQDLKSAIESSAQGDVILLEKGYYLIDEPLVLNQSIALKGASKDEVIISPSITFNENYNELNPYATYSYFKINPIIDISGNTNTSAISNLTLKGQDIGQAIDGIYSRIANLTIDNVIVDNTNQSDNRGSQGGVAIWIMSGDATITNSSIKNFKKNGIYVVSEGNVSISDNQIVGNASPISPTQNLAQNGLVTSSNSNVIVTNNFFSDFDYYIRGSDYIACAILNFGNLIADKNEIKDSSTGVCVSDGIAKVTNTTIDNINRSNSESGINNYVYGLYTEGGVGFYDNNIITNTPIAIFGSYHSSSEITNTSMYNVNIATLTKDSSIIYQDAITYNSGRVEKSEHSELFVIPSNLILSPENTATTEGLTTSFNLSPIIDSTSGNMVPYTTLFSSSNPVVATVDNVGTVNYGATQGEAVITATLSYADLYSIYEVSRPVSSANPIVSNASVMVGAPTDSTMITQTESFASDGDASSKGAVNIIGSTDSNFNSTQDATVVGSQEIVEILATANTDEGFVFDKWDPRDTNGYSIDYTSLMVDMPLLDQYDDMDFQSKYGKVKNDIVSKDTSIASSKSVNQIRPMVESDLFNPNLVIVMPDKGLIMIAAFGEGVYADFYDENNDVIMENIGVLNDGIRVVPAAPELDDKEFIGWKVTESEDNNLGTVYQSSELLGMTINSNTSFKASYLTREEPEPPFSNPAVSIPSSSILTNLFFFISIILSYQLFRDKL